MITAALICQQGIPFQVSPARTQMVEELVKRGSKVILFFPGNAKDIKKKVDEVVNTRRMHFSSIRNRIKEINPDIVICFTHEDCQICYPLPYVMKDTDFYYYNLEIYVRSTKRKGRSIYDIVVNKLDYLSKKFKEILYVNGCQSIVIQDKLRKRILKKYWISHKRTWLIPNSYYSSSRCDVPHKTGLIYSGLVESDTLGSFAENSNKLKNIEITISGWRYADIKIKKSPNIKIMIQNLSQEKYTEFISAYDIALIWYSENTDDNVYNIGLSSGKYFKHLSLGQPVIVNRMPGLAEEIEKNKVGIVIDDLSELNDAVQTITENYHTYVNNIKNIYDKRYDYGKVSRRFFDSVIYHAKIKKERKQRKST